MTSTPTHTSIQSLLETSACNPTIIPQLESYVRAQLALASTSLSSDSDVQYSFDANRALIKLYQFVPDREDSGVVSMVTFLALMNWPDVEVGCLQCLVGEGVMGEEPRATLVRCSELLESCRFSSFWPEFRKLGIPEYGAEPNTPVSEDRKLLANAVNGSKVSNAIRVNMLQMLGKVYKTAPLKSVLEALDLKDANSLTSFSSNIMVSNRVEGEENESCIVEKVEDGFVVFGSCMENSKRAGSAFKEGVGYMDIASMMQESKIRGQ